MYTIHDTKLSKHPIKIWLDENEALEKNCLEQAINLSNLPFLHKWVALMPDVHTGMGMPIGGVIATKDVIIPNAVGKDIGCGMIFKSTNIDASFLKETKNGSLIRLIISEILKSIPTGFDKHEEIQRSKVLDKAFANIGKYNNQSELMKPLKAAYYQVGTLGGGNHFIEIQEDEDNKVGLMLHSGSRHIGACVCDHFHKLAKELNSKWYSEIPSRYNLAFLPTDTKEGKDYIEWMNLCLNYAFENREMMMRKVSEIFSKVIRKQTKKEVIYGDSINCHHNYASLEKHYKENVWVHRKGAISAKDGELGIVPGAMGSYSYIVMGKGSKESFCSSSHGAGRLYSRRTAMKKFPLENVMSDLKSSGVTLGKTNKKDVPEESRFTYKNIENVISNEADLITPIKKLKTIGVVKG